MADYCSILNVHHILNIFHVNGNLSWYCFLALVILRREHGGRVSYLLVYVESGTNGLFSSSIFVVGDQ